VSGLRVAVVGVGHLGRHHARLLGTLEGVRLVAVVDSDAGTRRDAAKRFAAPAFAHPRELVDQIDAAIIATPTRAHFSIARALLERGVHLLVEKPLAATRAEAEELSVTARAKGLVLQVGHVERFNPAWLAARPHLAEPKYIDAARCGVFSFRSTDIGVVHDLMIHDLDLIASVVRCELRSVEALGLSLFGQLEDVANARLVFANGCVATLCASRASRQAARTMQIWTPRAYTRIDFSARAASIVRPSAALLARRLDLESLAAPERAAERDQFLGEHLAMEGLATRPADPLTAELEEFVECIRLGRSPRAGGEQACESLAIAERILESIAAHSWDGTAEGRVGPWAQPPADVIRPPHWPPFAATPHGPTRRKEAG